MDEALLFLRSRQHVDALVADIRLGTDSLAGLNLHARPSRLGRNCVYSIQLEVLLTSLLVFLFMVPTSL